MDLNHYLTLKVRDNLNALHGKYIDQESNSDKLYTLFKSKFELERMNLDQLIQKHLEYIKRDELNKLLEKYKTEYQTLFT